MEVEIQSQRGPVHRHREHPASAAPDTAAQSRCGSLLIVTDPESIDRLIAESSALLRRGIELVNGRGDLDAALACFDRATTLRRRLPVDAHPEFAYDLAACYLNRGEALLQFDAPDRAAAIDAFNAGVALLEPLPVHHEPRYLRRLAVALFNRGRTHLDMGTSRDAVRDLERAIELQAPFDRDREDAAAITLQARYQCCRDYASRLSTGQDDGLALAAAATDLAEEALEVCAAWERRGVSRFRYIGVDVFAFALGVYARFQPHFVDEFIAEWRDPSRTSEGFVADPALGAALAQRGGVDRSVVRFVLDPPPPAEPQS